MDRCVNTTLSGKKSEPLSSTFREAINISDYTARMTRKSINKELETTHEL
jgi:hypothetical protein